MCVQECTESYYKSLSTFPAELEPLLLYLSHGRLPQLSWSFKLAAVRKWLYSSSRGIYINCKQLQTYSSAKWP